MEGYLVRRIHVDQGDSVEVMFEHCFENLIPAMKSRLKRTQTDLAGFARDVVKPLGKVKLEVVSEEPREVSTTKEILVNPAYPEQLVKVGGNLKEGCKAQLQMLLKRNMDVFA
ncbi:hypothetical protein Tco_0027457 [Tanacetum coccineum]